MRAMNVPNKDIKNHRPPAQPPKIKPERKHAIPQKMVPSVLNLTEVCVFLWLKNGKSFWCYITDCVDEHIIGYIWNGRQWSRQEIHLRMVWSYY